MVCCDGRLQSVSLQPVIRYSRPIRPAGKDVGDEFMVDFLCSPSGVLLAYANPMNEWPYSPVVPTQDNLMDQRRNETEQSYGAERGTLRDDAHDSGCPAIRCLLAQPGCVALEEVIRFIMFVPTGADDEQRVDYFFSKSGKLLAYHDYSQGLPGVAAERDLGISQVWPAVKSLNE